MKLLSKFPWLMIIVLAGVACTPKEEEYLKYVGTWQYEMDLGDVNGFPFHLTSTIKLTLNEDKSGKINISFIDLERNGEWDVRNDTLYLKWEHSTSGNGLHLSSPTYVISGLEDGKMILRLPDEDNLMVYQKLGS